MTIIFKNIFYKKIFVKIKVSVEDRLVFQKYLESYLFKYKNKNLLAWEPSDAQAVSPHLVDFTRKLKFRYKSRATQLTISNPYNPLDMKIANLRDLYNVYI